FFYVLLQQLRNSRFGNSHFATENKKGLKQRGNHMRAMDFFGRYVAPPTKKTQGQRHHVDNPANLNAKVTELNSSQN
ncbi:MAG: hypothetical protein J5965_03880, partial [Aeriscardovia sp.]|nr:hypothetical protein [Aeriscardovia sp.]